MADYIIIIKIMEFAMIKKITKGIFIFLAITAVVVLVMIGVLFAAKMFADIGNNGGASAVDKNPNTQSVQSENLRLNVLVMGKDRTSGLCDMIMLASYDVASKCVGVVQIPRDTYAEYTEASYKKINGAPNSLGSERAFCDFLSETLCVKIDKYVTVDLEAVGEVVDLIGGVEVDIPFDMNYRDPAQGLSIQLKKGKTVLDGEKAQHFVRYRSGYAEGDIGRMDAQKIFLAALAGKLKTNTSLFRIKEIFDAVRDDVSTDISMGDIVIFAAQAFAVPSENVRFVTLAGESAVAKSSGASYYVISRSSAIEIVNEFLGGYADEKSFDRQGVFLNDKYDSFSDIYYSDAEYTVYDAKSLIEGQMHIAHK